MSKRRLLALSSLLLVSGCLWPVQQMTDRDVAARAAHPFDIGPELAGDLGKSAQAAEVTSAPAPAQPAAPPGKSASRSLPPTDVLTAAFLDSEADQPAAPPKRLDVAIPATVPGSETPLIDLPRRSNVPKEIADREAQIGRIYPILPPLPDEPAALPGPEGRPYTLADLQRIAAENSPTLRQAAADVQAAKGNVIAARAYPNPTFAFEQDPNNASSASGGFGFYIDQVIKTAGKLKLASSSALMDLANAELALKRSRSDLATGVRNAYYNLVVAKEAVRVNRGLARFTDEIYRYQIKLLEAGQSAPYEPAALRAQAYTTRLAYKQSIETYAVSWKQLVAVVGLRQLPLSEVAGRVDRLFPSYEYDAALAHALRNHTDVLTARNVIAKARYNLQLAQVTPIPDVDLHVEAAKETTLPPFTWYTSVQLAIPVPIWDQNKGQIIAAQAALVRALEEPHRVENNLTNNFAAAFLSYKSNTDAVDYYRRYILPDQVRYYRGVFSRRNADPAWSFGDLVQAQQTLATDVSTYLGLLGSLWSSVVTVADFLQTDDLFQQGAAKDLPPLPDFSDLPVWPCPHPAPPGGVACAACATTVKATTVPGPLPVAVTGMPAPRPANAAMAPVPPLRIPAPAIAPAPATTSVTIRPVSTWLDDLPQPVRPRANAPAARQPVDPNLDELLTLPPPEIRPPAATAPEAPAPAGHP
jgi:cobalt-zinc-cadmium efflux system outer membrane protein